MYQPFQHHVRDSESTKSTDHTKCEVLPQEVCAKNNDLQNRYQRGIGQCLFKMFVELLRSANTEYLVILWSPK